MAITSVRLVDGAAEMVLLPRADLRMQTLQVPLPEARAVTDPRVGSSGEDDQTAFHGGRAFTFDLLALQTPSAIRDELARFQHPGLRPYLYVADSEWSTERRLRLRADAGDAPIGVSLPPTMRAIQASFRVPDGVWEDADEVTTVIPADSASTAGLAVPVVIPAAFAAGTSPGAANVVNAGTVPLHWTARLYGPCTAPRLALEISGQASQAIVFKTSMVLGAGEYLEIDSRERTVWLLGDTSSSRLGEIDYTQTTWWQLPRGTSQVRYNPASGISAGAACELYTRTQWL